MENTAKRGFLSCPLLRQKFKVTFIFLMIQKQAQEAFKMRSTIAISISKELSIFSLRLQFGGIIDS